MSIDKNDENIEINEGNLSTETNSKHLSIKINSENMCEETDNQDLSGGMKSRGQHGQLNMSVIRESQPFIREHLPGGGNREDDLYTRMNHLIRRIASLCNYTRDLFTQIENLPRRENDESSNSNVPDSVQNYPPCGRNDLSFRIQALSREMDAQSREMYDQSREMDDQSRKMVDLSFEMYHPFREEIHLYTKMSKLRSRTHHVSSSMRFLSVEIENLSVNPNMENCLSFWMRMKSDLDAVECDLIDTKKSLVDFNNVLMSRRIEQENCMSNNKMDKEKYLPDNGYREKFYGENNENYLSNRKNRHNDISKTTSRQNMSVNTCSEQSSLERDHQSLCTGTNSGSACLDSSTRTACLDSSTCSDIITVSDSNEITVELAKQERKRQGAGEAEFSFGGEADLHKHLIICEKNPEHKNFIPRDQFTVDHLPGVYNNAIFHRYIQAVADLTVRVSVSYVSDSRPKTFPDGAKPYPFSDNRGSNMVVHGSGWVSAVDMSPRRYYNNVPRHCECKECRDSPTPRVQFYHIYIITAVHVVYDDSEAEATNCILFFDNGGTPETCGGAVTLSGMKYIGGDIETDWCEMRYETHDADLTNRLSKMAALRNDLRTDALLKTKALQKLKFKETKTEHGTRHVSNEDVLTVVVSHPHGCSKQISLGFCSYIDVTKDGWTQYAYKTPTCPGSSGGPVFTLSGRWSYHAHSGNCTEDRQVNYSSHGVDMVPQHPDYERKNKCLLEKGMRVKEGVLPTEDIDTEDKAIASSSRDVYDELNVFTDLEQMSQDTSCTQDTNYTQDTSCTQDRSYTQDTSCTRNTKCTQDTRCTQDTSCTQGTIYTQDTSCTQFTRCTQDSNYSQDRKCTHDTSCTQALTCTQVLTCN